MNRTALRKILASEGLLPQKKVAGPEKPFMKALAKALSKEGFAEPSYKELRKVYESFVDAVGDTAKDMAGDAAMILSKPVVVDSFTGRAFDGTGRPSEPFDAPGVFDFAHTREIPWADLLPGKYLPTRMTKSDRDRVAREMFKDRSVLSVLDALASGQALAGAREGAKGASEEYKDALQNLLLERQDWGGDRELEGYDIQFNGPRSIYVDLTVGRKGLSITVTVRMGVDKFEVEVKAEAGAEGSWSPRYDEGDYDRNEWNDYGLDDWN